MLSFYMHPIKKGGKPTRYFCNLESRNYINKTIHKLEVDAWKCYL